MSKSLGNTVSPEEMISKYGADTVRLFILFGANPEAGMDWSDSALEANHRQMFSIMESVDFAMSLSESPNPIDSWLLARLRENQRNWMEAMSEVSLREGVMISHFEMLSDWSWYVRRGGRDRSTAMSFLEGWIPMMAPATPHIAEEFWNKLGMDDLLAKLVMPDSGINPEDPRVISIENYIRQIISTGRNLKSLAERHSEGDITRAIIQTSPVWKSELAIEAIGLNSEGFDFKSQGTEHVRSMDIFNDERIRTELFQTWSSITMGSKKKRGKVHLWSEGERDLILARIDESEVIIENSEFIASSLGVDSLESYSAGEGEDVGGKAKVSFPLEPGIAFL